MTVTNPLEKSNIKVQLNNKQQHPISFCSDCVIEWCKIRGNVSYCSQKYKGTSCYNCEKNSTEVRKIASY